ncbi:MAG: hypothetical protein RLZZ81_106 [Pseudomonadota bacterium]|jgi:hypothetical protein
MKKSNNLLSSKKLSGSNISLASIKSVQSPVVAEINELAGKWGIKEKVLDEAYKIAETKTQVLNALKVLDSAEQFSSDETKVSCNVLDDVSSALIYEFAVKISEKYETKSMVVLACLKSLKKSPENPDPKEKKLQPKIDEFIKEMAQKEQMKQITQSMLTKADAEELLLTKADAHQYFEPKSPTSPNAKVFLTSLDVSPNVSRSTTPTSLDSSIDADLVGEASPEQG